MPDNAARFLGFAFASADLLFEVDPAGEVVFVMGAVQRVLGMDQAQAVGRPWRDIVAEDDHDLVAALIDGLGVADRRGPINVELKPKAAGKVRRFAAFSACRLPQVAPNVSCVMALGATSTAGARTSDKLHDQHSFMAATRQLLETAKAAGLDLDLELVELQGLDRAGARLGDADKAAALRKITAAVRAESLHGEGAARLGKEHFALLRGRSDGPDRLLSRLEKAADAAGARVNASSATLPLSPETTPLHTMRALRFALDSFIKDGAPKAKSAFQTVLESTVTQANAFASVVKDRRFQLVYQPVVDLSTGELQYFEALVRLEGDKSPAKAIHLAEELELIESLDLAVAERVIGKLKAPGNSKLKLAANVSSRSLMQANFMGQFIRMLEAEAGLADRLTFEITDSSVFNDLDLANTAIQRIRQRGFGVCLDDFGASVASLASLRALSVDSVKIDGQCVQEVAQSGRDSALVRHLSQLCEELGVDTIAEMVETAQAAGALAGIGVKLGQGFYFGRPTPEPVYQPPSTMRARRVGEVDSWR